MTSLPEVAGRGRLSGPGQRVLVTMSVLTTIAGLVNHWHDDAVNYAVGRAAGERTCRSRFIRPAHLKGWLFCNLPIVWENLALVLLAIIAASILVPMRGKVT